MQTTFIFYKPHLLLTDDTLPCYQMELVEMQNCDALKNAFRANSVIDLCASLPNFTFPNIKKNSLNMSTVFDSTYICEQTFSSLKLINTAIRSVPQQYISYSLALKRTIGKVGHEDSVGAHVDCFRAHGDSTQCHLHVQQMVFGNMGMVLGHMEMELRHMGTVSGRNGDSV